MAAPFGCWAGAASARRSTGCWPTCARARAPVLVVRGEAGVGKTALLEYVLDRASGCRVARRRASSRRWSSRSPGCISCARRCWTGSSGFRRRSATRSGRRSACSAGRGAGPVPGRPGGPEPAVGGGRGAAAALRRRRRAVARPRLGAGRSRSSRAALPAEPVGLVFAVREPRPRHELAGLPELVVDGLAEDDARALLESVMPGRSTAGARPDRRRDARQPARAARAAARAVAARSWRAGSGCPSALPLPGRIEESFRRRLEALPEQTRRLLLVAAAEPLGDPALLWRAAERLGIDAGRRGAGRGGRAGRDRRAGALPPSARALGGLPGGVAAGAPAACTARWPRRPTPTPIPIAAPGTARRRPRGPDEDVAAELERSAGRAQARGGLAAAAAFLERAAELTPDPARRAHRGAGRRAGQAPGRRVRRRRSGCWPPRRPGRSTSSERARVDAAARPDRVRPEPRQRRSAAAARGRQAARAARRRRSRARPTSTPSRRPCSPARPGGGAAEVARGRARAAPPARAAAAPARPAARRPGGADHRRATPPARRR